MHAFITSRVDYCNSLLYGLPASQLNKVQRVLNTAARFACCSPRFSHITPLMYELHWLPLKQRIHFKILLWGRRRENNENEEVEDEEEEGKQ